MFLMACVVCMRARNSCTYLVHCRGLNYIKNVKNFVSVKTFKLQFNLVNSNVLTQKSLQFEYVNSLQKTFLCQRKIG